MSATPSALRESAGPWEWSCACGVAVLAFLLRALPFANVFHAGQVIFAPADAMYHVRRSYFTFEGWPHVLLFDPYVNYPEGAPVPWSPLPDVVAGTIAAALASSDAGFERVLAWWPAVVGGLGALPVYFLARAIAPRPVAVAAGCLYALLPISVIYGRVGNPDHHVAAAAVGACLLLVCVRLLAPGSDPARLRRLVVALALGRATLLLTWHGSLLYLGVIEAALLLSGVLTGRRELHGVHAASALGTLLLIGPLIAIFPTPLLGPWSSIALSRLHATAVAGAGFVALVGWLHAARAPGVLARLAVLGGSGIAFVLVVLALPGPRAGLEPALRFLTMTDAAGAATVEQFALFEAFGRSTPEGAVSTWGGYAFLLPLAPVALALWAWTRVDTAERERSWLLAGWTGVFALLALTQRRYGNDVAAAASVAFAVGGAGLVALLRTRLRLPAPIAATAVALLGVALYAWPIAHIYLPWATRAAAGLRGAPSEPESAAWSLHRFLRVVREVTPPTSGYTHPAARPEYGIVSQANLGHALQWVARRATPTDPFWEYIGPENWDRAHGLLTAVAEHRAVALARELDARYVVVGPSATDGRIGDRLFRDDGLRRAPHPALRRFRLVTEGPRGGRPIQAIFEPAADRADDFVPYKLFEVVRGARLEIPAPAGARVEATLGVSTPTGRRFVYRTAARADASGRARLVVPYASAQRPDRPDAPTVETDPAWSIRIDGTPTTSLVVPEQAVLEGGTVRPGD